MFALDNAVLDQVVDDDLYLPLQCHLVCLEMNFRAGGRLVRIVDSGEVLYLACAGLLVQSLRIAFLSYLEGTVDKYLNELQVGRLVQFAHLVPIFLVWTDKARQRNRTGIAKKFGYLADTTDIFLAIFFRETEILVDAESNVVAIQQLGKLADIPQRLFKRNGNRALAAA